MKVFGEQIPEEILHGIGMKAMVEGINFSFFMSSILIFIALILAFFMKKATPAEDPFEEKEIQVSSQDDPLMTKVEDSAHYKKLFCRTSAKEFFNEKVVVIVNNFCPQCDINQIIW